MKLNLCLKYLVVCLAVLLCFLPRLSFAVPTSDFTTSNIVSSCSSSEKSGSKTIDAAATGVQEISSCIHFEAALKDFLQVIEKIKEDLEQSKNSKLREQAEKDSPLFLFGGMWPPRTQDQLTRAVSEYEKIAKPLNLTMPEYIAIKYYMFGGYLTTVYLNAILSSNDEHDQKVVKPLTDLMDSGLKKLPDYKGVVLRGASLTGEYEVGKKIHSKIYTSSTTHDRPPQLFFQQLGHFTIHSKHGKKISMFFPEYDEGEVLFPRGSKFKVTKISKENYHPNDKKKGSIDIEMEEIDP